MGDAKRRGRLEIVPNAADRKEHDRKKVVSRAKSEPTRPGFLDDFGRAVAANNHESIFCCINADQTMVAHLLQNPQGVSIQLAPSVLSWSWGQSPSHARNTFFNACVLTIECLSLAHPDTLISYAEQQLTKGVMLRVGYDRAYESSVEYVVPLMLEYPDQDFRNG